MRLSNSGAYFNTQRLMVEWSTSTPRSEHHFLQVSVRQRISTVPPHIEEDDLCLEMTPFK